MLEVILKRGMKTDRAMVPITIPMTTVRIGVRAEVKPSRASLTSRS
jgi:hypothetical protein